MPVVKKELITTAEIECIVAKGMDYRKNIIVPNVSWGAGLHECDLLIINPNGYATEIEIKISKSDLKADFKKDHHHQSESIRHLYYAIPDYLLETALALLPEHVGIITCKLNFYNEGGWYSKQKYVRYVSMHIHRKSKPIHKYRAMTKDEIINIGRLGSMRIWNLKSKIIKSKNKTPKVIQEVQSRLFS